MGGLADLFQEGRNGVRERYPICLIQRNSAGVSVTYLETRSDEPTEDPDVGLLLVQVPSIPDMEVLFSDSDERFPQGDSGPSGELVPRSEDHPHWHVCSLSCTCCPPLTQLKYTRTDMGWYLVINLPDGKGEVWVHEYDVPICNLPTSPAFGRRPPASEE